MDIEGRYLEEINEFGIRIKDLRKTAKLKQKDLKEQFGIKQSQISLIENGRTNIEFHTMVKLGNAFKVQLAELFNYKKNRFFKRLKSDSTIDSRLRAEKKKFGKRIKQLIEHRNMNQEQLAIDGRIDPGDLSRFINGDHNIEFINIVKLAIGLKVKLIDLFDYDGAFPA